MSYLRNQRRKGYPAQRMTTVRFLAASGIIPTAAQLAAAPPLRGFTFAGWHGTDDPRSVTIPGRYA